ncbi:MAG: hypothetical protein MN733_10480 [Nitrososphaera sp.]|nr:hypothetical protein [Nitrososphaera sp.]
MNFKPYLHRANDLSSLIKATRLDVGVEIDLRTYHGNPVVSHGPITSEYSDRVSFQEYLNHWREADVPMMLNIKEQGIIDTLVGLHRFREKIVLTDVFVPDAILAEKLGFRTLGRRSKYENTFGSFYGSYLDFVEVPSDLPSSIDPQTHTYLVSPELHREEKEMEEYRKKSKLTTHFDYPHINPFTLLTEEFIFAAKKLQFEGVVTDYPERWIDSIL